MPVIWLSRLLIVTATLFASVLHADRGSVEPNQRDSATITLNGILGHKIPGTVVGTNIIVNNEKNIKTKRFSNDVLVYQGGGKVTLNPSLSRMAKDLKLGIIRYPGGQESERYHWGEGVGPVEERKDSQDSYGRKYKQYLGILEIAEFTEAVNAELLLQINYSSGTLQEAMNLVEFCNMKSPAEAGKEWTLGSYGFADKAPKGYFSWLRAQLGHQDPIGVRYWEIGNEIYFTKDGSYLSRAHLFAKVMKGIDGSIKVGVTADPLLRWNKATLLKHKPDIDEKVIDWLSIHVYSFPHKVPMETAFTSNGHSERTFGTDKDGEYRICVTARGSRALGAPEMRVEIDGAVRTFNVDGDRWEDYCVSTKLTGSTHKIDVSFTNDLMVPGVGDRNLYIKDVVVKNAKAASIWNRKQDEYQVLFGSNQAIERQLGWIGEAYPGLKMFITEASPGYGLDESPMDRVKSLESAKLKSAIWYAGLMNTVFRQRVEVLNQFPFNGRQWGFNLVREDGSVNPIYDVLTMYSAHVNNELLDISIASPKFDSPHLKSEPPAAGMQGVGYIDAVATINKGDGMVNLTLLNRSNDRDIRITVDEKKLLRTMRLVEYTRLSGSEANGLESSRIERQGSIVKQTLTNVASDNIVVPAHSVVNLRYSIDQKIRMVH